MRKKLLSAVLSAVITVMSAGTFAMTAFAEGEASSSATNAQAGGSMTGFLITMVLMFVVLYFMAIRPQKKREQEAKEMQNSLQVGDEIITSGGIVGMVVRIGDDTVVIETGGERHKLRIKKWAIAENVTSTERAREAQAKKKTALASAGVVDDTDKSEKSDNAEKSDKKKSKKNKDSAETEE